MSQHLSVKHHEQASKWLCSPQFREWDWFQNLFSSIWSDTKSHELPCHCAVTHGSVMALISTQAVMTTVWFSWPMWAPSSSPNQRTRMRGSSSALLPMLMVYRFPSTSTWGKLNWRWAFHHLWVVAFLICMSKIWIWVISYICPSDC